MPLAATKRYFNVKSAVFTSGSAITFTGITNASIDRGGSLAKFSGDGDRFNTTVINDMNDPKVTVKSADLGAVSSCVPGMMGTLVLILMDAKNIAGGVGSGEITATLSNAVVSNSQATQGHKAFGDGTVDFNAYSADGTTSPLAFTIA